MCRVPKELVSNPDEAQSQNGLPHHSSKVNQGVLWHGWDAELDVNRGHQVSDRKPSEERSRVHLDKNYPDARPTDEIRETGEQVQSKLRAAYSRADSYREGQAEAVRRRVRNDLYEFEFLHILLVINLLIVIK